VFPALAGRQSAIDKDRQALSAWALEGKVFAQSGEFDGDQRQVLPLGEPNIWENLIGGAELRL